MIRIVVVIVLLKYLKVREFFKVLPFFFYINFAATDKIRQPSIHPSVRPHYSSQIRIELYTHLIQSIYSDFFRKYNQNHKSAA